MIAFGTVWLLRMFSPPPFTVITGTFASALPLLNVSCDPPATVTAPVKARLRVVRSSMPIAPLMYTGPLALMPAVSVPTRIAVVAAVITFSNCPAPNAREPCTPPPPMRSTLPRPGVMVAPA